MKVVIIGNGISGITAARWLRKLSDSDITIISEETEYFYSRTALMYIYMGHMRFEDTKPYEDWFWKKNNLNLIKDRVESIDFSTRTLKLSGQNINYEKLIIATGSRSNKFNWPGQDLEGVSGLYHLQDLENMEKYSKGLRRAVIVGGGLIGIEMAEMFHSRKIPVTMIVRESNYWNNVLPEEESTMVTKEIRRNHIDLRLGVHLDKILNDGKGKVKAVLVRETQNEISCGYVGLTPGVSPNVAFLKNTDLDVEKGILVNNFLETNIDNVYAIGDCAQLIKPKPGRQAIEPLWYIGRMMGETVAYNILGKTIEYDPGIWFNSAKFLNIEYHSYGYVPRVPEENIESLYWESKDNTKSIRIVYSEKTNKVLGFNLMGIRYRHEVCERWISKGVSMIHVLENLALANFDPEFYKMYEPDLIKMYNHQTGFAIKLKSKRKLSSVLKI